MPLQSKKTVSIHNIIGHYNSLVKITELVSHNTYIVCVIFYTYRLKSTPNDKLFMAILFTLRVFGRNLLREEIAEVILFIFSFDV